MAWPRATDDEWRVYYARAAVARAASGDPFKRRIERQARRERMLMVTSSLFVVALVTVFYLLTAC